MSHPEPAQRVIDVLLVEDDAGDALMIREAFLHHDIRHTLHHVVDGVEAMRFLRNEGEYDGRPRPDLILLDLNMPGASGLEVMKIIRLCRPHTKVLVISGHMTPEVRNEFQKLGQREFVQKPYRLDELGRHIRTLLEAKPLAELA